ncbi:LytR/AlgR family response regulator transcription factor [Adhaeribacter pallidiroseus]|uniref:Sensory transduction protein LytR n=1 Tax=Adhaeribacter pallidiroseus TaxID=2072847 RepID=A0A369QAV5_9BACT|nr:LytTR family DNA-binding domain-containing protein [Adhaeribacter pallidiroseus]RDC62053.1 Sensory transduction protein LytR [Adhaeribacter pallidiroseus]
MRALIIEDEKLAANRLARLLVQIDPNIQVIGQIESVRKAVQQFNSGLKPDVAFLDIQLADGLSFEIFDQTQVPCPVIFTTAYDEYAIKAFKVNSIDYLLKPIDADELAAALQKFRHLAAPVPVSVTPNLELLQKAMHMLGQTPYKNRFVVKVGEHIKAIPVDQVDFFFSKEKATFLQTKENKRFVIDFSLEQLENLLDPQQFFRINRSYMISLPAIQDIVSYSNSRLKTFLRNAPEPDVVVSREKVNAFKNWLDR